MSESPGSSQSPHYPATVAQPTVVTDAHVTVIKAGRRWRALDLPEIWRYRELLVLLAMRDIRVRYKQTALGVAWAVVQPLVTMAVFAIFFGRLAGVSRMTGDIPYPLYAFCALLPWQLFSYALTQSSNSVVAEQRLITKVYFPRLIVPAAPVISGLADFAIAFGLFIVAMVIYPGFHLHIGWALLFVPVFVAMAVVSALAVGLWLSALNALYRDVRYTIPFLTQVLMFASPIAYPASLVPEQWRVLYGLNPLVGVVEGFRWSLLGGAPPGPMFVVSAVAVLVTLVGGLYYFRRMEAVFADVV